MEECGAPLLLYTHLDFLQELVFLLDFWITDSVKIQMTVIRKDWIKSINFIFHQCTGLTEVSLQIFVTHFLNFEFFTDFLNFTEEFRNSKTR